MNKVILIAPDSFKECASSVKVAKLIQDSLKKYSSNLDLKRNPISDGGDGFLEVCQHYFGGKIINYRITTPYDNSSFECPVLYHKEQNRVYVESANVVGLKVIPQEHRNPMNLSSKGMGELILGINQDVKHNKIYVDEVIIGIGGTGTMDMGLGMCSRLGMKFISKDGKVLDPAPNNVDQIEVIGFSNLNLSFIVNCIIDVRNPLTGLNGAAYTFGRQKGASQEDVDLVDNFFSKIVNLLRYNGLVNFSHKLSGAGGGLAAGFQLLFNSKLISGEEFIENVLRLKSDIVSADYIITGEGAFDGQSYMGKGAGVIVERSLRKNKNVFLICGQFSGNVDDKVQVFELQKLFSSKEESINKFTEGIKKVCKEITKSIK